MGKPMGFLRNKAQDPCYSSLHEPHLMRLYRLSTILSKF
mgnify:CR=1 FL=1